jgi:hypothetical protein
MTPNVEFMCYYDSFAMSWGIMPRLKAELIKSKNFTVSELVVLLGKPDYVSWIDYN